MLACRGLAVAGMGGGREEEGGLKALSLWQPWASYIAQGAKRYETRGWATSYRGPLAIHAAKRPMREAERALLSAWPRPFGSPPMPFGAVIATARLADCIQMTEALIRAIDKRERELGDWRAGRWAWVLLEVMPLQQPVPTRGAQGLFDWERGA